MYNPLQFFNPVNARFDQAGGIATQIAEQNLLRGERAKQEKQRQLQRAGAEKYIGLQGLMQSGALEGDAEGLRIAQEGMRGGALDALGSEGYFDFQLQQQREEARRLSNNQEKKDRPRIESAMLKLSEAKRKAFDILNKYFSTDSENDRSSYRGEYMNEWDKFQQARAELGRIPSAKGHHIDKLDTWAQAIERGVDYRGAERKLNADIQSAEAKANVAKAEESDIYAKIARQRELHKIKVDDLKKGSANERLTAGFAQRMIDADEELSKIPPTFWQTMKAKASKKAGASDNSYFVNADDFVASNLRKESGASIQDDEKANAYSRYIPKYGDDKETIETKARIRKQMIDSFIKSSGSAYTPKAKEKPKAKVKITSWEEIE